MKKISKSDYISSLKCLNVVWHKFNDKSKLPSLSGIFAVERGVEFGELAQKLYEDGILIDSSFKNYSNASKDTESALEYNKPIFEATFETNKLYCKVDILRPSKNGWDIIEVKSSSKVKKEHYDDVAFQKYVLESAGVKINNCYLLHANKEYVRNGDLILKELFKEEDISDEVNKISNSVEPNIARITNFVSKELPISKHKFCSNPKRCDTRDICWSHLPDHNILQLHGIWFSHAEKIMDKGILSIVDLPDEFLKSHKHVIQKKSLSGNSIHRNDDEIKKFKSNLKFPISYFDFETLASPIPLHNNLGPWEKFPFQYSVHIDNGNNLIHREFMEESNSDPRENLIKNLIKDIPSEGSIVTYNMAFEKAVIKKLYEKFPKYEKELKSINERIVDLYTIFKNFNYYHPKQKGSASIKYVLPAVTGKNYDHLEVQDGSEAFTQYYNKYYLKKDLVSKKALYDYCAMDTIAMYDILNSI